MQTIFVKIIIYKDKYVKQSTNLVHSNIETSKNL